MTEIKTIAFDADDTLWVNEPYFRKAENEFCHLLDNFIDFNSCQERLFEMEMRNLALYGYGIKPFTLSLIECAQEISNNKVSNKTISQIIELGKEMLNAPVVLLDGIEDVLENLSETYRLVVATKGDLLDQERKLVKSGLSKYFHHIEVMSDKQPANYMKLVKHLDISSARFLMVGNSLKSDILPVLEIGGRAIHIPFHTTWAHEQIDIEIKHENLTTLTSAKELVDIL